MKTWRGAAWAIALTIVGLSGSTANASWCNAFEVCWHRNQSSSSSYYYAPPASVAYYYAPPAVTSYYVAPVVAPTVSYYAAPAASCAPSCTPCQTCQTNNRQRSSYTPVPEYQSKSYYEPVTQYNTSYYYEPVTSYSYSSYYDACSCSYQQVAQPTVSYQLRSQSCPTTSWVQRCQQVPVTSYKMSPTTSRLQPARVRQRPPPCNSRNNTQAPPAASVPSPPVTLGFPQPSYYPPSDNRWQAPPAGVSESTRSQGGYSQGAPPAGVSESTRSQSGYPYERSYPPSEKMPPASGSSYKQPARLGVPAVQPTPSVHLERMASAPHGELNGQVVQGNWQPAVSTRLVFVNADRKEGRKEVVTDNAGRFTTQLTSGGWLVYVEDAQGKPVFSRALQVHPDRNELVRLVSR